jgi:transcriptional regulator with XRE-family HTH domain
MSKKSITVIRKKRGRPPTGQDPITALRLPLALKLSVDNWANQRPDKPTRSEAIRRLIELGLAGEAEEGLKARYRNQNEVPILAQLRNRNNILIMLPVQCRMARAALSLGLRDLAAAAKVSVDTVARFERGQELKERTIEALQRALEAAGTEFTNGDQPGVRLTKAVAARTAEPASPSKPKPNRGKTAGATEKKR